MNNTQYPPSDTTEITPRVQTIDRTGCWTALDNSCQEVCIRRFGNTDFVVTLTYGISASTSISLSLAVYHVLVRNSTILSRLSYSHLLDSMSCYFRVVVLYTSSSMTFCGLTTFVTFNSFGQRECQ